MKTLNELEIGEEAVVTEMHTVNRRLKDLGLVDGTRVRCMLRSPLGDPAAYKFRGAVVAIRKEDALNIVVEVKDHV